MTRPAHSGLRFRRKGRCHRHLGVVVYTMPHLDPGKLEKVYTETAACGVQFLGIDVRDDQQAAQDFVID